MSDAFHATVRQLSRWCFKTIVQLTVDQPALRREATQLRRQARGTKLGRRMRRKTQLGMAGSF